MKISYSASSLNEGRPSLVNRRVLVRLLVGVAAVLSFWLPQSVRSATVIYNGSGELDDKKSWSEQVIPSSRDEAIFDVVKSDIFSTESLNFGNIVWNNNTSSSISMKANGITRYLTLSGEGVGEATIKAGGSKGDLLLMGENAKSSTLKFEAIKGNGELQIQLDADGNFNVLNAEATLDISVVVTGDKSLTKTGEGTLIFGASNTYTGVTTVKSGTLKVNATNALGATKVIDLQGGSLLVGASDTLNDMADILMGNAKLEMIGKDITEYDGALTLTGNSVIDVRELQGSNNFLYFASSYIKQGWATNTSLSIWNWDTSGEKHIYFGSDSQGLSETQLRQISFYSDFGNGFIGNAFISNDGEITTIPEAQTIVVAILLLLGGMTHLVRVANQRGQELIIDF
jgi:autotransporter-associated beta strand protein